MKRRTTAIIGALTTALAVAVMATNASAAYCSENDDSVLYAGANTSCQLASNAANHAITHWNLTNDWPLRTSGYSSVTRSWYRFGLVGYYTEGVKYRGHGRDGSVAFSLKFKD